MELCDSKGVRSYAYNDYEAFGVVKDDIPGACYFWDVPIDVAVIGLGFVIPCFMEKELSLYDDSDQSVLHKAAKNPVAFSTAYIGEMGLPFRSAFAKPEDVFGMSDIELDRLAITKDAVVAARYFGDPTSDKCTPKIAFPVQDTFEALDRRLAQRDRWYATKKSVNDDKEAAERIRKRSLDIEGVDKTKILWIRPVDIIRFCDDEQLVLEMAEIHIREGKDAYLYHDRFMYEKLKENLPEGCYYAEDDIADIYYALVKILPGFDRVVRNLSYISRNILDEEQDLAVCQEALEAFVTVSDTKDLQEDDLAVLSGTLKEWEARDMKAYIGKDAFFAWERKIWEVSDAIKRKGDGA